VSSAYATLETRLYDIMVNGRGVNGALGSDALAKSIPVGRFRAARMNAPLRDTTYPSVDFDRAVFVEWLADADDPTINNPLDSPQHREARVAICNAVTYGNAVTDFLVLTSGEVAATVIDQPRQRALNDSARIQRALGNPDLLRGGTPLDPAPLACVREGGTTLEDLGSGRMLATTVYALRYQLDNTQAYDP
jgi:hypothetical protein